MNLDLFPANEICYGIVTLEAEGLKGNIVYKVSEKEHHATYYWQ